MAGLFNFNFIIVFDVTVISVYFVTIIKTPFEMENLHKLQLSFPYLHRSLGNHEMDISGLIH